ncbi:uncharacterized protein LOC109458541 isoform X1 [Rhinolophus sinicus]|uniref:uncharacterized protein LOC109458541 isoform X1 n=2 Tax=Rhinolophus sinicus TaxID=89399 RepID=UPI003D7BB9B5
MRITEAFKNPRLSEITPLIRSDLDIPSSLWLRSAPAPGNPTPARPRMLSAPPRAQSPSRLSPTQPHAPEARAWSGCAAPAEAAPVAWASSPRMLRCGARRPPQSTRARMPQKFGSGSVGSKMRPKPRFTEPRANKHAQAFTQTSPRPALAAAGLGHGRPGKSPGSTRGRRSRSAAKRLQNFSTLHGVRGQKFGA